MTASVLRSREPERVAALIDDVVYRGVAELFEGLQPYRGLAAALDELAGSGLRIAALSDLPPLRKLELMGLERRFEPVLCSEDSGSLKPAPEPFRMLCSALGLESAEILYVGNSRAYDLEGARAAGMAVAIVSRLRVPGADLSFADWSELSAFALSR
jgi:putative hydrolase of the HAD superfamily